MPFGISPAPGPLSLFSNDWEARSKQWANSKSVFQQLLAGGWSENEIREAAEPVDSYELSSFRLAYHPLSIGTNPVIGVEFQCFRIPSERQNLLALANNVNSYPKSVFVNSCSMDVQKDLPFYAMSIATNSNNLSKRNPLLRIKASKSIEGYLDKRNEHRRNHGNILHSELILMTSDKMLIGAMNSIFNSDSMRTWPTSANTVLFYDSLDLSEKTIEMVKDIRSKVHSEISEIDELKKKLKALGTVSKFEPRPIYLSKHSSHSFGYFVAFDSFDRTVTPIMKLLSREEVELLSEGFSPQDSEHLQLRPIDYCSRLL